MSAIICLSLSKSLPDLGSELAPAYALSMCAIAPNLAPIILCYNFPFISVSCDNAVAIKAGTTSILSTLLTPVPDRVLAQ